MQQITSSNFDQEVLCEQVTILYRALFIIVYFSLLMGVFLAYQLKDLVSHRALIIWLLSMAILVAIRTASYVSYRRHFKIELVKRYAVYFTLGSAGSGILWGCAGFLFFPEQNIEHQYYLLIIFFGLAVAGLSSLHAYLPVYYAFLFPQLLPVIIKTISQGDSINVSLGTMLFFFLIGMAYFGFNFNRSLMQSLRLRFENVELVKQLREQKEEAEKANIAKSKFLAAASHDLRQPLHALMLFTSVLDEAIKYPKIRKVVDKINASVDALQSLFNALLDISRLDAGVLVAETTHFKLQPMFKKLANDYSLATEEKGLALEFKECALVVFSDPTLLEQIMRNLVTNAIRYTNDGTIIISCVETDDFVRLDVTDTGIGIPANKHRIIFDEFYQLGNPQRDRGNGLGLGLAIVERIARLLNHPIEIHSILGEGSTFSIFVNKGDVSEIRNNTLQSSDAQHAIIENLTIVVVDDELSIREGMQILLQSWGCNIIATSTLNEAIQKLTEHQLRPDGIIADFRLAGTQTGIQVIQHLYAEYGAHIPALIVTGDIEVDRLREVNESGFQLLHKPVAPTKLRAFVNNVMKNKQRHESK
ncbi:MAG: ATP-binding protein [Thiohalomonadales bacterium]